jgi:hypothetical protein
MTKVASSLDGRRGDDDLLGAAVDVGLGLGRVGEEAGGLDDDVGADLAPVELGRVALGEDRIDLPSDGDRVVVVGDVAVEAAEDRVVLEQVARSCCRSGR